MSNPAAKSWDMLRLLRHGGPALCNVAVTNSCNATCDFCNFAYNKGRVGKLRWIDAEQFDRALEVLYSRGVRYISFFGGETLLHPRLPQMIAQTVARGMGPAVITNGWLLPARLSELQSAGLKSIYISIDSGDMAEHERNRGLKGLGERIRTANARMPALGMKPFAQVTMSKLIRDYRSLVPMLREYGFAAVAFSYPQQTKLGSTTLAWSDDSALVKFAPQELIAAFDAVEQLRDEFPVNNPSASIADMKRHLRGEPEQFVCLAGYKSFYMDWNYDVWRCDAWHKPMCSVWEFATAPFVRDGCTACIADCYRDSSVMLHFAVALGDAADSIGEGRLLRAIRQIANRSAVQSVAAVVQNSRALAWLGKVG